MGGCFGKKASAADLLLAGQGRMTKVLILGSGESGKTTLIRNLKFINNTFTDKERSWFVRILRGNLVEVCRILVAQCHQDNMPIPGAIKDQVSAMEYFSLDAMTEKDWKAIADIWTNPTMQAMFQKAQKRVDDFYVHDSASYFFEHMDRITADDFSPSNQDILHARALTVGINTCQVERPGHVFNFVDVGGQKNERRKWIHMFDDVAALIWVVSLSEFDTMMAEDVNVRRSDDTRELFKNTANLDVFLDKPLYLVFNKVDLFKMKLDKNPEAFKTAYPDFSGPVTFTTCVKHIIDVYQKINKSSTRPVKVFQTTATNEPEIQALFDVVETSLEKDLKIAA